MSDEDYAMILHSCAMALAFIMFSLIVRGCSNDERTYKLEKLRIERQCPKVEP